MIKTLNKSDKTSKLYNEKKVCLIMDNAIIHKSKKVLEELWKTDLRVLYLPPYHPMMNPAEYCFRTIKGQFYRLTFSSR